MALFQAGRTTAAARDIAIVKQRTDEMRPGSLGRSLVRVRRQTLTPSVMYCPECGDENPDDARYCGTCGAPMRPIAPQPSASAQTAAHPSVSTELKLGIAVATVIIPLIGIVMGVIYLTKPDPAQKAAGRLWLSIAGVMFLIYCFLSVLTTGW
jgi:hypothetical protein